MNPPMRAGILHRRNGARVPVESADVPLAARDLKRCWDRLPLAASHPSSRADSPSQNDAAFAADSRSVGSNEGFQRADCGFIAILQRDRGQRFVAHPVVIAFLKVRL